MTAGDVNRVYVDAWFVLEHEEHRPGNCDGDDAHRYESQEYKPPTEVLEEQREYRETDKRSEARSHYGDGERPAALFGRVCGCEDGVGVAHDEGGTYAGESAPDNDL